MAVIVEINWIRAEDWTTNIAIPKTMVQTRYGWCKDTDTLLTNTGQNRIECSEASWQVRYWSVKGDSCFFNWKTAVLPPPPTLNYSSWPSLGFAKRHSGECRSVKVKVEYRYTNSDTIQCWIHSVQKKKIQSWLWLWHVLSTCYPVITLCLWKHLRVTMHLSAKWQNSLSFIFAFSGCFNKKICAVSNSNTHILCACETMCELSLWNNMNVQNYTDWNVLTSLQLEEYNHWYSE